MRVVASLLAVGVLLGASAVASPAPSAVGLRLPTGRALYPGENLPVTVVDDTASSIYHSYCFVLARREASGWRQVVSTHGVRVACPIRIGELEAARSSQHLNLVLYDDLSPGTYRITLYYRPAPRHWKVLKALTRRDDAARLQFTVGPAPIQSRPRLAERRLLHLALSGAKGGGDSHPSLIQHAAGSRFEAVWIGQDDLAFAWNWSYLIAIRGHFHYSGVGPTESTVRGKVMTLVVDAATGEITDSGLSNRYPALSRLGSVTTDLRR